ncbi:MAG: hypothetical protein EG828_14495 [Deltaproteobacteria bacterium]|nr:hypothetical protein [Deltaproteobacteria bacterium]
MKKRLSTLVLIMAGLFLFSVPASAALSTSTWYTPGLFGYWGGNQEGTFPNFIGTTVTAYGLSGTWSCSGVRTGMVSDSGFLPDGSDGFYRSFVSANTQDMAFTFSDGNNYTTTMTGTSQYTWYFNSSFQFTGSSDAVTNYSGIIDQDHNFILTTTTRNITTWNSLYGDPIPSGWEAYEVGGTVNDGFRSISAVPVPGALWLLGSGLLCLPGFRRSTMGKA